MKHSCTLFFWIALLSFLKRFVGSFFSRSHSTFYWQMFFFHKFKCFVLDWKTWDIFVDALCSTLTWDICWCITLDINLCKLLFLRILTYELSWHRNIKCFKMEIRFTKFQKIEISVYVSYCFVNVFFLLSKL